MTANKGDDMLVKEIQSGNTMAFEAMVLKYQPKLMSSLVGYTKSHDQAEELCQKTFLRVWQKIDSFRGDSALFTWIYRIGINLAKNDFASSYAKSSKLTHSLDQDEHDVPQNYSPESILIAEESEEKIMNFINLLFEIFFWIEISFINQSHHMVFEKTKNYRIDRIDRSDRAIDRSIGSIDGRCVL